MADEIRQPEKFRWEDDEGIDWDDDEEDDKSLEAFDEKKHPRGEHGKFSHSPHPDAQFDYAHFHRMSDAEYQAAGYQKQKFKISDLTPTQDPDDEEGDVGGGSGDGGPLVVPIDGKNFLIDGHHRAERAGRDGTIDAWVPPELAKKKSAPKKSAAITKPTMDQISVGDEVTLSGGRRVRVVGKSGNSVDIEYEHDGRKYKSLASRQEIKKLHKQEAFAEDRHPRDDRGRFKGTGLSPESAGILTHNEDTVRAWWTSLSESDRQAVRDTVQRKASNPIYVRLNPASLRAVLSEGRFKNSHDTKGDEDYNQKRLEYEKNIAGLTGEQSRSLVYGYVGDVDDADAYGPLAVRLKSSVRGRTTVTNGDSLNARATPQRLDGIAGISDEDLVRMTNRQDILALPHGAYVSYMEAQIDGVAASDIEAVVLPEGDDESSLGDIAGKLHEFGIAIETREEEPFLTPEQMRAFGITEAAGNHDQLKHYWTATPEGLAKWKDHPHPWTALYEHIRKHVSPDGYAKAITSSWYREVFGHMPNEKPE